MMFRMSQVFTTSQVFMTGIGFLSGLTYVTQSWSQIKRHGFRHWIEAGFEKLEQEIDGEDEDPAEELT